MTQNTDRGPRNSSLSLQPTELQPRSNGEDSTAEPCAHGCEDGFLFHVDELGRETASPCPCRPARIAAATEGARRSLTKRKREQCRRAGRASGRRRRQLARGKRVLQGHELPLVWSVRQVSRSEFDSLYGRMCEREGLKDDARGRNTVYALYRVEMAAYYAQGQDFETTNGQRETALSSQGRPRCRRTVQRQRKRLELMELVAYRHIRRSGPACIAGQMDTLRVHLLPRARARGDRTLANVIPPSGAERGPSGPTRSATTEGVPPAAPAGIGRAGPGLDPPFGGNGEAPNEEERRRRWAGIKQRAGWPLSYAERLALARAPRGDIRGPEPGSSGTRTDE